MGSQNSVWAGEHYYQRWEVVKEEELDHLKKYRMQEKVRGEHLKQQEEAENRLLSQEEAEN